MYPHIGILMYYWFSWLNPHRLVWGIFNIDWGKVIAITTLIFLIFSQEKKKIPNNVINILVIVFFLWTCVTTFFSHFPEPAFKEWVNWLKIFMMMIVTTILINTKERLHGLIWIVCISMGYWGVKSGLFTLATAGNFHVLGPSGSAIHGTNEISRAFMMTIPLLYYLTVHSYYKYVRVIMFLVMILTILALVGTTSRTAFLVFAIMIAFWWIRTSKKLKIALFGIVSGIIVIAVLPTERLEGLTSKYKTSSEYETDVSFQGRVVVWNYVVEKLAANSPIVGGGFKAILNEAKKEPHSNYFQVLGEHGYVGLVIYLFLGLAALIQSNMVYNQAKRIQSLVWVKDLALMLQISFIGYFLGGITKNHAFFEFYYMQLAMLVILEKIVREKNE